MLFITEAKLNPETWREKNLNRWQMEVLCGCVCFCS